MEQGMHASSVLNEYLKFVIWGSGLVSCGSLGCGGVCVCMGCFDRWRSFVFRES